MKEIKFTPAACAEGKEFSGSVTMRVPMFDERYEVLDQMGIKIDKESGEAKLEDMGSFSSIRKMVKASIPFYKSVEIKHSDLREFKSVEDMLAEPDCDTILIEVAMAISRGFRPGKN
jgi:hypothetical protein